MEIFETLLIFVALVIVSSFVHTFIPKVPLAFIQIFLGMILYLTPIPVEFNFDSELFMVTLIAPLLFVEGVNVSRVHLRKYIKPVMMMALGLVITTVIGVGLFIHWIWPELPIGAAFAIAAILCPTDAVAVQAITKGKVLPKGSMTILEGESLLNDAAGIISFKIAVGVLITGTFSIFDAIQQFLIASIGGAIVGLIIGMALVRFRLTLMRRGIENINMFTFIQLLTPFVTYLIAELFHASGIIAAVVAGLVHGFERDRIAQTRTQLQMSYNHTWSILGYVLNGFVFSILGFLVPEVIVKIIKTEPHNLLFLIVITLLVALAVYLFRFVWVYVLYPYFYLSVSPFQKMISKNDEDKVTESKPKRSLYALIMTLCGVHGTISLAIALTLPYLLANHETFAYRNDLLFIASGMVILSLIIAQVILPLVTPDSPEVKIGNMSFKEARIYILEHVIDYLNQKSTFETSYRYGNVIKDYHDKLTFLKTVEKEDENSKELERLQKIAFNVETKTLEKLVDDGEITESVLENYMRYAERTEVYKQASLLRRIIVGLRGMLLKRRVKTKINSASSLSVTDNLLELGKINKLVHYNVVSRLAKEATTDNKLEVGMICDGYLMRIDNLTPNNFFNSRHEDTLTKIKLNALREQRRILRELIENDEITEGTALKLRESINYDEMVIVDSMT
ncbi:sodium:proton antiporter [Staphylococcus epidermidis]|uniref:Na+/H+ antiporter, putative n=17 Tax=root TaxID=1 RepID=Q5HRA4_STAEQ|nr:MULTISPECIES: sodium:proton antiporter [Staphylococcus]EHQ77807.1 putative Na+/H+ antiporter [Staphylococcus epidermidis VCU057]EHR88248.1 putative Na+/H+ antiporter [Staphylococcus epidermidis VCU123]EID34940.1 putative Na+/H+ antiporter [Staphylococcus epidermidis IS-250]EJD82177.1 putative Na+/H+ antiporter [Staphylococcus epidermidis NIHLM088]EJD82989.1 putative Na+/H+ antiporter [Staphylococcus epidermidis NIHLM070]EON80907.1 Na+/H+ antiporter [Staphylococcus epidermidis 41tr]EON8163